MSQRSSTALSVREGRGHRAAGAALLTKFKQAGMEVITPDAQSFRKPVVETLPKMFEAKWGKGTYEQILDTR